MEKVSAHNNPSLKNTARLTGLLYFLVAVFSMYGYFYLQGKIFARGDIATTAEKMLANESDFRSSIATGLTGNIFFLTTILFLRKLFKQVNETASELMMWFGIIAIPVLFIDEALQFTMLFIFKGDLLHSFTPAQSKEIAAVLLNISGNIGRLITFHWGLWLMPMGWLAYKSGFIPRIFGPLLWINGLGYMIASITFILWPDFLRTVSKIVFPSYFLGEFPLIFWLLIKGVKAVKQKDLSNASSAGYI